MTAYAASILHWAGPFLTAATALALILVARALPSQPTRYRADTSPKPMPPVSAISKVNWLAGDHIISDCNDALKSEVNPAWWF
jgi:hypothetical protein